MAEQENKLQEAKENVQNVKEDIQDAKDVAKIAAKAAAGDSVGAAKDAVKKVVTDPKFVKKTIKRYVISTIIPIVALVLVGAFFFAAIFEAAQIIRETLENIGDTITGWVDDWISGDGINVDDDDVDAFIEQLERQGVYLADMGFGADEEDMQDDPEYENLSNTDKQKKKARKYIKKFMEASLVTQTPWTNDNGITGIPGGIKLERHDAENNTIFSMSYVENIEEATSYNVYSLDSDGNVVFKGKDGSTKTIDLSVYEQYTLPIMYFIDLCLVTQNPKYVEAIANQIISSAKNANYSFGTGVANGYSFTEYDRITWSNNYSKEDFVNYLQTVDVPSKIGGDYVYAGHSISEGWNEFYASHAEEWFDICTENGLDPIQLIAWSCYEKGYGRDPTTWQTGNILSWGETSETGNGGGARAPSSITAAGDKAMYLLRNTIAPGISKAIYNDTTGVYHSIATANGWDANQYDWETLAAFSCWYGGPGLIPYLEGAECWVAKKIFGDFVSQYAVEEGTTTRDEEDEDNIGQMTGAWMTIRILDSCVVTTRTTIGWYIDEGTGQEVSSISGPTETRDYTTSYYLTNVNHLLFSLSQTYERTVNEGEPVTESGHYSGSVNLTRWETTTTVDTYGFTSPTEQEPVIKCGDSDVFVQLSKKKYKVPYSGEKIRAYDSFIDGGGMLFELMDSNLDNELLCQVTKYVLYKMTGVNFGVTELDLSCLSLRPIGNSTGVLSITNASISKEDFIEKVQSYAAALSRGARTAEFRENAETIYDVCVSQNINPVLCAAQAWKEQNWIYPNTSPYNYWGIAVYNGQNYGTSYENIRNAVLGYCRQINSQLSGSLYSTYQARAAEFATVNNKFRGDMSTIYDVFSAYAYIGDGHTLEEEANYAANYVDSLIQCAVQIFGSEVLGSSGGITTQEEADALTATYNQWLNTQVHYNNGLYQSGPFAKWWSYPYNALTPFQCTWWANGRASMYLEQYGTKYKKYPTQMGNGGEYYSINKQNGWFNYGSTPKANSILSWSGGTYGHVLYVEGVTNEGIWVSDAGSGVTWRGVRFLPNGSFNANGYIYLDEPR